MSRRSPYQGLHAFGEEDQTFFSGRARDVRLVVANLFASKVTLLYGPSGVGKSSVVHAGVLPELRKRKGVLAVSVREWSEDPVRSIGAAVAHAAEREFQGDLADLVEACVGDGRRMMLVLDQFEHALTVRGTQDPLVESVSAVLRRQLPPDAARPDRLRDSGLPVSILIVIREESLADLDRFKGLLPGLFDTVLRLEYLDREAGAEAIRQPLVAWETATGEHVEAEDALVDAVLDAVPAGRAARGVETAQLQLVMSSVWDAERGAGSAQLRSRTFRALGGADGIVRAHVRDALDGLAPADRALAAVSLDRLVTPSGARVAHRIEDLAGYADVDAARLRPVLERLSDARVLRPVAAGGRGGPRFEVYHELLADAVLAWLTANEAERRAAAASARLRRRVGTLIVVAAIAVLVAVVLAGALIDEKLSSDTARSRALSATARRLLSAGGDPQLALALARKAADTRPTREAEIALRAALAQSHERAVLRTRAGGVWSVDFSRDGRTLLTAEHDGRVRIWDRATARPLRALTAAGAVAAAFCPDERRVAVAGDRGAELLSGNRRLRLGRDPVDAIACSKDGTRVAMADSDGARVLDVRTGKGVARLRAPSNGTPPQVALSADGRRVAVPADGGTVVLDLRARRRTTLRAPATARDEEVTSVAFSPDGRRVLTGGGDGTVLIRGVAQHSPVTELEGHESFVSSVAYSPDGTLVVSAAADRTARVWDAATGGELAVLRGHDGNLRDAVFAPDGRTVATASDDGTLRLWRTPGGTVLRSESNLVFGAFARDGKHVVTATGNGTVDRWDAARARRTARFKVPSAAHVAASPDASVVVVIDDSGHVRAWDPTGRRPPADLARGTDQVLAVDYSPRGAVIALATESGRIRFVTPSGRLLHEFRDAALGPIGSVAFSPDGRRAAAVASIANRIVLVDARNGRRIRTIRPPDPGLTSVAFGRGGAELIGGGNDGARIWDARSGRLRLSLRGHAGTVQSATFSEGGDLIATAGQDGETRLWDAATGDLLSVLPGRTASFGGERFILTTGAGPSARLHACDTCGRLPQLLRRSESRITRPFTDAQLESYIEG